MKKDQKRKKNKIISKTSRKQQKLEDEKKEDKIMQDVLTKNEDEDISSDDNDETLHTDADDSTLGHKEALSNLRETDPEFYKFLKQNDDELLQFDDEASSSEDEKLHSVPDKLEVASDDSEASDDDNESSKQHLSVSQVKIWRKSLQTNPSVKLIKDIVSAFRAAVGQAAGSEASDEKQINVRGSPVFNAVVTLCLVDLQPALHKLMKLPWPPSQRKDIKPKMSKSWEKLKKSIKLYLMDLSKVLSIVADSSVTSIILKHVNQMTPFISSVAKITRQFLKTCINLWCTGEESVRVLSFLCIMNLCRNDADHFLDYSLKHMYMAYVKNCKFTSPITWPIINFMKRSLVEVYALDDRLAYQHAFVYIRQLAIHLRNAITIKKKDSVQSVYNWQYIHCLLLWTHLLVDLNSSELLKPLIYPLVQTIIGTIKLIPTQRYFPLRFHCVQALIMLTNHTNTFIPVLPFILEALEIVDMNKKHGNVSIKPLDFTCALKLSKKQLGENGFKDRLIDEVYEKTMDYLNTQSHKIGFPELVLPATLQLKTYVKKCKVTNYNKQLKQLMDKIIENNKFVTEKRKQFTSSLSDSSAIELWENELKLSETPIGKFYKSWRKMKDVEILRTVSKKDRIVGDDIAVRLPKHKKEIKVKVGGKRKTGELFSSSEDDDDDVDIVEHLLRKDDIKRSKMSDEESGNSGDSEEEMNDSRIAVRAKKKIKDPIQTKNVKKVQANFDDDDDDDDDKVEEFVMSSSDNESDS